MTASVDPNLELAQKIQQQFDFYFIALIFSILGLSIQKAKFGANVLADSLELAGWTSLLIAGLVGLSRLIWIPVAYKRSSDELQLKNIMDAVKAKLEGFQLSKTPIELENHLKKVEGMYITARNEARDIQKKKITKFRVKKYLFGIGVCCLVLARATPVMQLISALCTYASCK